ncbi:MAG: 6-phosphofructokinase, partial [Verrucomicrobia bacterium]|nr:6-phosphofructokinase [Verrucomicrobiota bacterium]
MPRIPYLLQSLSEVVIEPRQVPSTSADAERLKALLPSFYGQPQIYLKRGAKKGEFPPLRIGVVLSGGQAPGGHNVIAGLCDGVKSLNPKSHLFGFTGGPSGVVDNHLIEITDDLLAHYRNVGGFDLIGSGRTKIESEAQLAEALKTCTQHDLDGLVIVGGDDSNTNAAILADYFKKHGCKTCVIGVPKTIDGDLKGEFIEISFGHDTACRVYSEMIGNLMRDAMSARKYWHFIKLMGRSASHIALECALQT